MDNTLCSHSRYKLTGPFMLLLDTLEVDAGHYQKNKNQNKKTTPLVFLKRLGCPHTLTVREQMSPTQEEKMTQH